MFCDKKSYKAFRTGQCHLSSVIIPDKALAINVELVILEMYLQESFHLEDCSIDCSISAGKTLTKWEL